MYKITGKQRFGAVWANGECLATFNRGTAHTNDTIKAEHLMSLGYTVEGSPDQVETDSKGVKDDDDAKEPLSMDGNPPAATKKKKGE